jgi:uncharacterized protein YdeI (YjbR/CyaY-like superfamily)
MTRKNPQVDAFLSKTPKWRKEFEALRKILLASRLDEGIKWRLPCYSLGEGNVAILQGFKDYCAVMFFKGALLKDPRGILVAPGASQAGRQVRFTGVREIAAQERTLKAYIAEAIKVEKAGMTVTHKKTSDYRIPAEFQTRLDKSPALKTAFRALTPGRQRAYLFYFADAKQSSTRKARVDKAVPRILKGKGLND